MEFNWDMIPKNPTREKRDNLLKSSVQGVYWRKEQRCWRVSITRKNAPSFSGSYNTQKEAEDVALEYRKKHPPRRRCAGALKGYRNGSSKYKGVTLHRGLWQGGAKKDRKFHYLGGFKDETAAALAYDKKALELWGDEAYTNQMAFPEDFR